MTHTANIRPFSYVSDLEGVFDLCWLDAHKTFLEEYSGSAQAGGKFEALLMALGLITAAQERRKLGLQTYILKADLLQGLGRLGYRVRAGWCLITPCPMTRREFD